MSPKAFQSGQVALMMVLMMLVTMTIVLSVASRSVTDVKLTVQEENKMRAFSAAEAGIEDLLSGSGLAGKVTSAEQSDSIGDIDYKYTVTAVGSGTAGYVSEEPLVSGDSVQINLAGSSNPVSSLNICWGGEQPSTNKASLEISVYKNDGTVRRWAVNENVSSATKDNDFYTAPYPSCPLTSPAGSFHSRYKITTLASTDSFMRIKVLYNSAYVGVIPESGSLPAQAYKARVTSSEAESTAAVEVIQAAVGMPAAIFDYVLWSGGNLD